MKIHRAALLALAAIAADASADTPKVRIVVGANGFKGTKGQAIVALYNSSDSWLKLDRALKVIKVPITGTSLQVTFADVAPGVYAVSVIHDENSNGKLDMKWFPPGPAEGAGVSNDATATFGPPSYNDARVRIGQEGGLVTIRLRY